MAENDMIGQYDFIQITSDHYDRCQLLWGCDIRPQLIASRIQDMISGNRISWGLLEDQCLIAEGALHINSFRPDCSLPNRRIYLSLLVVDSRHQRRGIGGQLLDHLIESARCYGYQEMTVEVNQHNVIARRLYQKKGFDHCLYQGEDEHGLFQRLMKRL